MSYLWYLHLSTIFYLKQLVNLLNRHPDDPAAAAGRLLRVEIPSGTKFVPSDPSLAAFLRRRLLAGKEAAS